MKVLLDTKFSNATLILEEEMEIAFFSMNVKEFLPKLQKLLDLWSSFKHAT